MSYSSIPGLQREVCSYCGVELSDDGATCVLCGYPSCADHIDSGKCEHCEREGSDANRWE